MSYAYYVDKNGKVTKNKKKKKQTEFLYTVDAKGKVTKNNIDDIAPVKSTKKKEKGGNKNSIFKSGGFSDGVDGVGDFFGDLGETIVGTVGDIGVGLGKGLHRFGEGVGDQIRYGIAGIADKTGNDDYAERLRKSAIENDTDMAWKKAEKKVDKTSVLGDRADAVTEGIGYVGATLLTGAIAGGLGASAKVATAITRGVQGASAFGSGMSEAYQSGATNKEATTYGAIASAGEIISSSLFGGLGKTVNVIGMSKGLSSADDMLAKKVSGMFTNQIAKNFAEYGIKAGAEGTEEVLSGIISAVGKKATYMDKKELSDILKDENLLEQFAVGAITSGIAQSGVVPGMKQGSLIEANKQGTDFITGRTQSEQSLIDSLVEEQTAQKTKEKAIEDNVKKIIEEREEAQGGVLSEKNKQALRKTVMDKIDSGEIDISSNKLSNKEISAITKEIEQSLEDGTYELSKIEDVLTSEQTKQIKELEEKLKTTKDKTEISNIQKQLSELKNAKLSELQSMTKNNRYLNNAIYEKQQSQKAYEYDDTKVTDEYEKATRESARTHLNNSKESRKLADIMSKLAKDRQTNYRFTNKQELKEQGDLVEDQNLTAEEKTKINNLEKQLKEATTKEEKQYIQNQIDGIKYLDIGGFVRKNADGVETVIINAESSQSINSVVGHETKHLLEKNKDLNEEFDKLLFDYAKSKGDYDVVRNYIEKNYEGIDNVNIDSELSAELTGRYLFTDDKFIESLINDNKNPKKQTIVQKIKELIDDLVVRFKGTEQEKQLRQVQKKFKELYNQNEDSKVSSKENAYKENISKSSDTKYSLSDSNGKTLTKEQQEFFKDSKVRDENGNLLEVYHGTKTEGINIFEYSPDRQTGDDFGEAYYFTSDYTKAKGYSYDVHKDPRVKQYTEEKNRLKKEYLKTMSEDVKKAYFDVKVDGKDLHELMNDEAYTTGGEVKKVYLNLTNPLIVDAEGKYYSKVYEGYFKEARDGGYDGIIVKNVIDNPRGEHRPIDVYIAFKNNQIKNVDNTTPTTDADIRYSLSDSDGKTLTKEQQEYFKDSKVRDENGNLMVVYHGTPSDEFTIFNGDKLSNQTLKSQVGQGFYFTNVKREASAYGTKKLFECYIDIKNPFVIGADTLDIDKAKKIYMEGNYDWFFESWIPFAVNGKIDNGHKLSKQEIEGLSKEEKVDLYFKHELRTDQDILQNMVRAYKYDEQSKLLESMKKNLGYDGVIHKVKNVYEYVVYDSSQIKNTDNINPTADKDIRYSLSDSNGKSLTKEQQEYFKDSKMRDDNGNLLVMYHGSRSGGFTVFDPKASDDNRSFFFSDKPSVASSYSDSENEIAPTGKEETKGLYKTYLNLKNPYIVDANGNKWNNIVEHKEGDEFLSYIGQYMDIVTGMDSSLGLGDFLDSMNGDLVGSTEYAINELYIDEDTEESILTDDEQTKLREIAEQIDEVYNKWNEDEHLDEDGYGMSFEDYVRDNYNPKKTRQIAKEAQEKGYDGVIFKNLVDVGKFADMTQRNYEESTVAVAFDSNQIKSVTNETPTTDADIRYSLSKKGEQLAPYGNYNVYGKDIALEQAPVQEVAPVQETKETVQQNNQAIEYAPLTEEQANERDAEQSLTSMSPEEFEKVVQSYMDDAPGFMFDDDEIRAWAEEQARQNPQGATPKESIVIPESPLEERDIYTIGRERKTNAYMYENPEVKPFFQEEAQVMLWELENSTDGKRGRKGASYGLGEEIGAFEGDWYGTKRQTSDELAYLRDNFKYDKDDLTKGLKAIIEDHGAENNAVSKRIEFMLDERLREGYKDFMYGQKIPPNQDYINLLNEKQITEYSDEAFNNWAKTLNEDSIPTDTIQEDIAPIQQAEEMQMPTMTRPSEPNIINVPSTPSPDGKQRKWVETSTESEAVGRKILPEDLDQDLITYKPISNKETLNNANTRLERKGYEKSVEYFNNKFEDKEISLDDIVLGERLIQEAVKKGDMKTAGELIQNVAILGTELGQKVQALSIIQRLTPEGQLKMLTKVVERGKDKGDKTFEGVEITQEMIDHILKTYGKDGTYNQDELNQAVEEVKQKIADQMKVTTAEKINAWRYLSMLGNAKTHGRNLISNVGMKGTMAVKDAIARIGEAGYDKLSKKITFIAPIETRTKTWKVASEDVKEFSKQTTKEMKEILSEGSKYSETSDIKAKRQIFKNKILNKVYEFNSDLLAKEDWWFQGSAFNKAFSEYLTANGIETKEDIQNNSELIEKAKVYATEQSEIATFKQYSFLANKIREVENHDTLSGVIVGAVLPFKQTPVNIAKAGVNYSPLGFMKTLTKDVSKVKNGDMEASQLIDNLSQNLTGTGLALAGYMLAMSGFLNGAGKEDKEGKYDYQLGKQAYSVNIGGKTYSLSWLTPMAMPLFVGANAFEILTEGKEWDGNVVIDGLAQTLDPMSEMSLVSGIMQTLHSFASSGDLGKLADMGKTTGQNYVGQFIPTISSQLATFTDDKQRSTKVAGDSDFKYLDETVNKLKLKIPGLRQTLEPSTDVWGNEVKLNENKMEKAFETFIAPYSRKENTATEIDEELKDLYSETGDGGLFPQVPKNSVNYKGEKYNMSAKEYTSFKKTYGQNALDLMEELFRTTTYKNASSSDKADMVDKVYDYANDEAKREYLAKKDIEYTNATKDGEAYYKENNIKGAIENDMPLEEFDFYNKYPKKYEFLQSNNVSYEDYTKDKETREAYNWAYENPERYTLSKSISKDLVTYKTYTADISKFRADTDRYGKTIRDSKKKKVLNYINGLDAEYGEKLILYKSIYYGDDTHNYEIVDYLNNRDDITFDEMNTILKELGFTVTADGTIYWN